MGKRKAKYVIKVSSGVTTDMRRELLLLQAKTGRSRSSLIREAVSDLTAKYKKAGY